MRIVRIAVIATLLVAASRFFPASTLLAELLPSDSTVTFVVDKRAGVGDFTTIGAAINQIKANADASPNKPYRVLIVPSPTPYNECINLSGLRNTEIAGLGGTPRIDYTGAATASCPLAGADIVGCNNPSQGCKSVTVRDLSVVSVDLGTSLNASAVGGAYDDILIKDLVVRGDQPGGESLLRLGPCLDTSAPYGCSFLIDGVQVRSPVGGTAYIQVFEVNTRNEAMSGRVKGAIVNSYLHSDLCPWKTAIVRFASLNATRDSHLLFEGNTVVCEDMMATGSSEGTSLVGASNGYGSIQIVGNQFIQTIRTDRCGAGSCFHAVLKADHTTVTPGEIYVQDNTVHVIMKATGLSGDTLAFIDSGPTDLVLNQNWYLSGNDFRVIVDGGDFNVLNARDILQRRYCGHIVVDCAGTVENSIVYVRDQELRYGIQIDAGSQGQVLPWPASLVRADEASVRRELTAPVVASSVAPNVEGAVWVDPGINRICYRSGGASRCLAGCGDGMCIAPESQCSCVADCGAPPTLESSCSDGVDNNCDGLTDAQDPACAVFASIVFPNEDNFTVEWTPKTPRLPFPNPTLNFNEVNDFTDLDASWVVMTSKFADTWTQVDNYRLESASMMAADHRTTEVTVEVVARGVGTLRNSDVLQLQMTLFARGTTQGASQTVSLPRDTTYRTYLFTNPNWNTMGLSKAEFDDMTTAMRGTVTKNTSLQRDVGITVTSVKVNVKSKRP
jgi:hypothetical protein